MVRDSHRNLTVKSLKKDYLKRLKRLQVGRFSDAGDILLYDNLLVLYKPVVDVFIYVIGGLDENEIMLQSVLTGFAEALSSGLK
jgi:hypothetical protein